MPINKKSDFIHEISIMLRRECVQFEPKDWISLRFNTINPIYFVNSVYYDFDTGRLGYEICNEDGSIVNKQKGYRDLEHDLTPNELKCVLESVSRYCAQGIDRTACLSQIRKFIMEEGEESSLGNSFNFGKVHDGDKQVCPDICLSIDGVMGYSSVSSIHLGKDGHFYVSVLDKALGKLVERDCSEVTDIGLKTIVNVLSAYRNEMNNQVKEYHSKVMSI